jgi:hypothetical protein
MPIAKPSQHRRIVPQQRAPHDLDGWIALTEERVVELA